VKINEIFTSIQGEGVNTGIPMTFIRLQGCDVSCSWCDTKESWDSNLGYDLSIQETVKLIKADYACITGGEPCLQDLIKLTQAIKANGKTITLETSGTQPIKGCFDWVTLSPKLNFKKPIKDNIRLADEIKFLVGKKQDIQTIKTFIDDNAINSCIISIQPISLSEAATQLCIDNCIQNNWHLSLQSHKFINIR